MSPPPGAVPSQDRVLGRGLLGSLRRRVPVEARGVDAVEKYGT